MTDEGNFFCIPNAVADRHLAALSGSAVKVYLVMKRHMNQGSGASFSSYEHLMDLCGISRPSISKAIRELEQSGLIFATKNPGRHSVYQFNNFTGKVSEPVQKLNPTSKEKRPPPVKKLNPNKTKEQDEPNKTKKGTPIVPYSSAFDRFWDRWPAGGRKVDKAGAWRIWAKKGLDA